MLTPSLPDNEGARLAALHTLLLLDTQPEQRFNQIVEFAAREYRVPIALITLLDADRQWFKASVGMGGTCQTSRDISFCGHTILRSEIMVVPDAKADPRFHDNPLVDGPPHIRFYAGAPLILSSGYALGSLCIIDTQPRDPATLDLSMLAMLRHLVMRQLEPLAAAGDVEAALARRVYRGSAPDASRDS
ncbi:GAF domain-containing protein [Pseudoduganella armeniaca]|uniref:Histidine kinase n=1 Tax=Pseudoduganella armeniaca TaxID=2072590 RepID=A0A2R4CCX7_9BURK|nr:GAF domain-containing protein [Pseudoduganella armeniaca]AVR97466.1 histidine kinase [Pseudoduganella armeniaca]